MNNRLFYIAMFLNFNESGRLTHKQVHLALNLNFYGVNYHHLINLFFAHSKLAFHDLFSLELIKNSRNFTSWLAKTAANMQKRRSNTFILMKIISKEYLACYDLITSRINFCENVCIYILESEPCKLLFIWRMRGDSTVIKRLHNSSKCVHFTLTRIINVFYSYND